MNQSSDNFNDSSQNSDIDAVLYASDESSSSNTRKGYFGLDIGSVKRGLTLFVVVVLVVAVFAIIRQAIIQAPSASVTINSNGLSDNQVSQLAHSVESIEFGSYFSTDIKQVQEAISELDWVDEVNVTRDWHKGIEISALSKIPVAKFGSSHLVDAKGEVFKPSSLGELTDASLVTLQGQPEQAHVIMQQMQQVNTWYAPLNISVEDIVLTPRMTWVIKFDSGLRVIVDGQDTSQKLLNLSQVLQTQFKAEKEKMETVDLRYKNGFAISWK